MAQPAISSGALSADAVIMAVPAVLMGIVFVHDNSANALTIDIWDSPTSDLTGDTALTPGIIVGASPGVANQSYSIWFGPNGIQADLGIFVDVTFSGTLEYVVYYR